MLAEMCITWQHKQRTQCAVLDRCSALVPSIGALH